MAIYHPPLIVQQYAEKAYPLLGAKLAGKIEFLVVIHALLVPLMVFKELKGNISHFRTYPLHAVMVCCLYGLGGSNVLSAMMGRPFASLLNDYTLLTYMASALFFITPLGTLVYQVVQKTSPVSCSALCFLNALIRAVGVRTAVQYVKETAAFRNNTVAMLAGVFVYMHAGPIVCSMFNLFESEWELQIPVQLTEPLCHVAPSMLLGFVYVFLTERLMMAQNSALMCLIAVSVALHIGCMFNKFVCGNKLCKWTKGSLFRKQRNGTASTSSLASTAGGTPRRSTRLGERKLRSREGAE